MQASKAIQPIIFTALGVAVSLFLINQNTSNKYNAPQQENIALKKEITLINETLENNKTTQIQTSNQAITTSSEEHYQTLIDNLNVEISSLKKQLQEAKSVDFLSRNKKKNAQWDTKPKINIENNTKSNYSKIEEAFLYGGAHNEAEAMEAKSLTAHIENTPSFSDFSLSDAECKENTCRMQLAGSDGTQLASLFDALNSEFSVDPAFSDKTFLIVPDPSTGLTNIYFGDENSDLMNY